jgi:hypothetical protein
MRKLLRRRSTLKGADLPSFANEDVKLEGYLHKKSANGIWQRRYFQIAGSFLRYFSEKGSTNLKGAVDLTALVKCNGTVDSTFILHLSDHATGAATQYQLRAESTEEMLVWCEILASARHHNEQGEQPTPLEAEKIESHDPRYNTEAHCNMEQVQEEEPLVSTGKVTVQELAQLRQLKGRLGRSCVRWKHRLELMKAPPEPPLRGMPPALPPPRRRSTSSSSSLSQTPLPPPPAHATPLPGQHPSLQQVSVSDMAGWSTAEADHWMMTTALDLCSDDVDKAFALTQELGDNPIDFLAAVTQLDYERISKQAFVDGGGEVGGYEGGGGEGTEDEAAVASAGAAGGPQWY